MTYYFSSEDLKDISENLEEINKKIILKLKNNSNYFIILITKYLLLFSDFVINQYEVRRKIFISNYLNEIIYQIDYIDIKNNKIPNVYYTNFILAFFSILNLRAFIDMSSEIKIPLKPISFRIIFFMTVLE